MNFLPQRPKEIIRKYEQLDARDELNAACSEIANRISEKQKQRMDLHGALEDLVSKKTETKEDILKLQRQLKSLKEEKLPKLKEMETENDRFLRNEYSKSAVVNLTTCSLEPGIST